MDEYISREATLDIIREVSERYADENLAEFAYNIVINIPAADVQPVKHGRWIVENRDNRGYADCFTCTHCKTYVYTYTLMKDCDYDFCPNCGARMDGDAE